MSKSIPNVDWANQLESVIRQFVKEKLELIMREEIKNFLEIEQAGTSNMRNGYYQRNLDTQYGRIEGLLVPRDRNGEFQTQLLAPYQRHTGWLEEAIIKMYQSGMSTREIGKWIERMKNVTINHILQTKINKIRGFSLSPQETEYSVSCGEEISSLSIPNPFQGYPIYLALHKILEGTFSIVLIGVVCSINN